MATNYHCEMYNRDDIVNNTIPSQQQLDSENSPTILQIYFQLQQFLQFTYPEYALIPLSTINNSYSLQLEMIESRESCQSMIQTILFNAGVSSSFIDTVTPDISSFAFNVARTSRYKIMTLFILATTPFDDHEVIDRVLSEVETEVQEVGIQHALSEVASLFQDGHLTRDLSEVETMFQDLGSVKFNPASESFIEGLKRLKLDKESLCCGGDKELAEKCVICFEEFLINDEVIELPCQHVFHENCGVKWLQASNLCPLCRFECV